MWNEMEHGTNVDSTIIRPPHVPWLQDSKETSCRLIYTGRQKLFGTMSMSNRNRKLHKALKNTTSQSWDRLCNHYLGWLMESIYVDYALIGSTVGSNSAIK